MARRERTPEDDELRRLGVHILNTVASHESDRPLLALLQRDLSGGIILRRSPRLTDQQRATVHDMTMPLVTNDGRLPPFTEWQQGHLPTLWVYGITAERIERWREAGRTRQKV